ncbi:BnaA10g13220D [Brassica napus]|uniref:BnaA10g13220D protein n=1 Tax=Brassica napus TaxID=3708 RepID=A0A078H2C7_BRANA|nr:BnaA10g13220D [Brassica napus]
MRIGCLPNMRNIYLWRRKSKKVTKANEFSIPVKDEDKLKETEEFWLGEYVDSKSQIHDSSTSIKNESLNEKEVIHSEPGDELYKLIYDSSSANKNGTQAKQESIQDQAIQEYEGGVKSSYCDGLTAERRGTSTNLILL